MELRLGGEQPADLDAVEPAREAALLVPDLDRVRPAEAMQHVVGAADRRGDPAVRPRRVRAPGDDGVEGRVDGDLVAAQRPAQRARDVDLGGREDAARVGAEPGERLALVDRHGEDPGPVGRQQGARGEVGADREQPVVAGALRRREPPHAAWRLDGHADKDAQRPPWPGRRCGWHDAPMGGGPGASEAAAPGEHGPEVALVAPALSLGVPVEPRVPAGGDPLVGDLRRAGLLPLLVLHYVSAGPSYGNQLIDRIEALTHGALAVNPNTMYPLLRALEARGLLAGEWEHPARRSRRFYRITPAGEVERDRLAAELAPRLDRIARSVTRSAPTSCASSGRAASRYRASMGRATASTTVPGLTSDAEALWYDPTRWPAWIDGFGHLATLGDGWPAAGARRVWDAPAGRGGATTWPSGRVAERVRAYEARIGQTLELEDARLRGSLAVSFAPQPGAVDVALSLDYALKRGGPFAALEDVLVVRRAVGDSLRRTLARFAAERRADVELGAEAGREG